MTKSVFTLGLIIWLALLQGIAPLLHAHVHDLSMPGTIHLPALGVDANAEMAVHHAELGWHQLRTHLSDDDAIGVESAGKNEQDLAVLDVFVLLALSLLMLVLLVRDVVHHAFNFFIPRRYIAYRLPWALAPPATH
jgi:hypothetical protein